MSKKILVIEDDKSVRENIEFLLSEEGYIVLTSKNGDEGVKIAKKELPDLILCDIMMPRMSGYEVLQQVSLFEETKTIPFVFLTAKVEKNDIRTGMNLGADDYLFKPFDADDLLKSIESRLKRIEALKADIRVPDKDSLLPKYSMDDKLFIQVNSSTYLINIAEIIFITAEKQYSSVNMVDRKSYLIRKPLSNWEAILPDKKFMRIHRSTIINIDFLVKMEAWYNAGYIIYLKGIEKPFIISRRFAVNLRGKLLK